MRRHKTARLLFGDPPSEVELRRGRREFYLLQRIQEEVHRFAITFHRQTRGKTMTRSLLDEIPGVGKKRKQKLYKHFGSLERMRQASVEEYRKAGIGDQLAQEILDHLRRKSAHPREKIGRWGAVCGIDHPGGGTIPSHGSG